MNNSTNFRVLFYLRSGRMDTDSNAPIYARVTVNGKRADFSIQRSINVQRWDNEGHVKGNKEDARTINAFIDTVRNKLYDHHKTLVDHNKLVTAEIIRNLYFGKEEKKMTLIELINYHNELMKQKEGIDYASGTVIRYNTILKNVEEFLAYKYRTPDILLSELNYKFVTDFEHYLKTVRKCNHNSTLKYLRNLRKVVNVALNNDWLVKDPFARFKGSVQEVEREILNEVELKTVEEKHFDIPRLELVKDIFVFSCYTGLAYIDVAKLTPANIILGIDGKKWLYTHRTKTDAKTHLPLLPPALAIVEKYKDHPECKIRGTVLPVLSNQKLNSYLKEIADTCKIKKNLTFHIARHTFATTVTLSNGVPMETVSKMLAHKSIRTTQIYAKVIEKKVGEDMATLEQRLFKANDSQIVSGVA